MPELTPEEKQVLTQQYQELQGQLAQMEEAEKPAPESDLQKAKRYALGTLGAVGKGLDVAGGATTRPLLAAILEAAKGKDVYRPEEHLAAVDPTNLETFPSTGELLGRAGVPEGAKMSDYLGGYAEPGSGGFLHPEKGGLLDITARGTGGFLADMALDPLNYLSFGAAGAAKRLAVDTAAKEVGKEVPKILGKKVSQAVGNVGAEASARALAIPRGFRNKVLAMPGGKAIDTAARLPSIGLNKLGKKIYRSGLIPVEYQGKKFGKSDVADTFYKHGIWGTAPSIARQAGKVEKKLASETNIIKSAADNAGAQLNLNEAFEPFTNELMEAVANGRLTPKEAESLYAEFVGRYANVPAPDTTLGSQWKSDAYGRIEKAPMSTSAFDASKPGTLENSLGKTAALGLKDATETAVDRALGEGVGTGELALKNEEWGKLLTVRNKLRQMAEQSEKKARINVPDLVVFGGGGGYAGGPKGAAAAYGIKKALDFSRSTLGRTGTGYGLRKASEGLKGAALDAFLRREYINKLATDKDEEQQ